MGAWWYGPCYDSYRRHLREEARTGSTRRVAGDTGCRSARSRAVEGSVPSRQGCTHARHLARPRGGLRWRWSSTHPSFLGRLLALARGATINLTGE